ncbi:MAG: NAD-dependent epimerase/dehydratase family protein [Candidatus Levybacteria bacterium]|nr:NAD-dependent epimerase/dehydratase family protein [Candidatus Levybacteria bacterium]
MTKIKSKQKTSLVTGGAGFIGSHVVDSLLKMGQIVIVIDDLSGGRIRNINPNCIFINGSILDEKLLDKMFGKYEIDYLYHLAAYAAVGLSPFIRKFNYENNLIGSINLINRSVKNNIKHFIFTSSISVYGNNQNPMTEDASPLPEDPYGIAKYATELDLKAAYRIFGLRYTIFRPHNVYGERQNYGDPYRNVVGIFMNNLLQGKSMPIFGDGKQKRAFSYIDDVAPYIANCVNYPNAINEVFNVGADNPYSVIDLAHKVAKAMGKDPKIQFLPRREELVEVYCDHAKIKKIFKIEKTVELEDGLKKMANHIKTLGPISSKKFKNIEIRKNIPLGWKNLI